MELDQTECNFPAAELNFDELIIFVWEFKTQFKSHKDN